MLASRLLVALVAISCTFAHPINQGGRERILGRTPSAEPINQGGRERILGRTQSAKRAVVESGGDDFSVLVDGNKRFRDRMAAEDSGLLQRLSDDGQGMIPVLAQDILKLNLSSSISSTIHVFGLLG